ncbi:bifunctional folylpolyglutamate synthase/dihydrofolate synthase [Blastomonas aquatica]|uniref:Bifunctional folylpolyglutamate synthase/dihydrofolate synthase n=1 Tax=Blastomonas aquatica TaxID=1510276 RepID=A0ABQ1JPT4_9SPHN|nr:bifunctional folylpolyglutamate synthase/dihydrofolate synthase [Blastomonas aquatica]GGB71631.1 bifunctional folylpolyglutamate synthase/dihydrofolate synthase [Blastomonas aquatica]
MPDHAVSSDPAVQTQLDRLAALSPGRDVLGLERITALLARLGDPHHDLPPVFHVAGTNGKGSTCAFLRAAIEASGQTAHVYTSPHLVRFNERIRIAGRLISDDALAGYLARVLDIAEGTGASFFEVTTAAAFLAFAETPADACIIEVGLGGRLDATNVLPQPAVCGIAALGIDHEAFLLAPEEGTPDLPMERIAFEKAGIAKQDVPLVIQRYATGMMGAIAGQAMRAGAYVKVRGEDWDAALYQGRLHYRDVDGRLSLPVPRLPGEHQADNAALAVAMIRHQSAITIPDSALSAAMGWADWPARLQRLSDGPLTALLGANESVWLDGGHNPDAGAALAKHVAGMGCKVHLIIGMLSNKQAGALLGPLEPYLASVTALPVPGHAWHDADAFQACLTSGIEVEAAADIEAAFARLAQREPIPLLIAGSLYLAGEVLKANGQEPD